ncbi:MAG: TonB-dependent receptor, partial [Alphaproteobacteria bacterium]
ATLSWRAAMSYTDARFDGGSLDGLRPAQAAEWSATAGLVWRATEETTLSADLRYESDRFEDDLNSRVLEAAAVLDLRAEQALTDTVSIYAALDNALDAAVETAETAGGNGSRGPPQALRLGVRLRTGP